MQTPMVGAVDIGGTKIAAGIVDADGKVLARLECPTDTDGPYEKALDRMQDMLKSLMASTEIKVEGIGIGSTGPVDPVSGEFGEVNFFPHWQHENPVRDLAKIFGVSVAIENDGDAAALGEAAWGVGKNKKRLIYVTVGTGIGVGIVLDGMLYRGTAQAHPEIGHHLIDPSGPLCACGFHGCWESLAAGPAIVGWVKAHAPVDYPYLCDLTAKRICELARQGDQVAQKAVQREGRYLGLGLANIVTFFAPDAIVLGGSLMKSADLFLDEIRRIIIQSCKLVPFDKAELLLASLGDDSNLIGAARVWYHRLAARERHCA